MVRTLTNTALNTVSRQGGAGHEYSDKIGTNEPLNGLPKVRLRQAIEVRVGCASRLSSA